MYFPAPFTDAPTPGCSMADPFLQALQVYPWLDVLLKNPCSHQHEIRAAIEHRQPLATVLSQAFHVSRRGLQHMSGAANLLPQLTARQTEHLIRVIGQLPMPAWPQTATQWKDLLSICNWADSLWQVVGETSDDDRRWHDPVASWLTASIWRKAAKRKASPLDPGLPGPGVVKYLKALARTCRQSHPGQLYDGTLKGHGRQRRHTLHLASWIVLYLLDCPPRDLIERHLSNWSDAFVRAEATLLNTPVYSALGSPTAAGFPVLQVSDCTLEPITDASSLHSQSKQASNCLASHHLEAWANGDQTVLAVRQNGELIGHVVTLNHLWRARKKAVDFVEARRLNNQDFEPEWLNTLWCAIDRLPLTAAGKPLQAGQSDPDSLHPHIRALRNTRKQIRCDVMGRVATAIQARVSAHFTLTPTCQGLAQQLDLLVDQTDLVGANHVLHSHNAASVKRPARHARIRTQAQLATLLNRLPQPEDVPDWIVARLHPHMHTQYRSEELIRLTLLSASLSIKVKQYILGGRPLSRFQIDALIKTMNAEGLKFISILDELRANPTESMKQSMMLTSRIMLRLHYLLGLIDTPRSPQAAGDLFREFAQNTLQRRKSELPSRASGQHDLLRHVAQNKASRYWLGHLLGKQHPLAAACTEPQHVQSVS